MTRSTRASSSGSSHSGGTTASAVALSLAVAPAPMRRASKRKSAGVASVTVPALSEADVAAESRRAREEQLVMQAYQNALAAKDAAATAQRDAARAGAAAASKPATRSMVEELDALMIDPHAARANDKENPAAPSAAGSAAAPHRRTRAKALGLRDTNAKAAQSTAAAGKHKAAASKKKTTPAAITVTIPSPTAAEVAAAAPAPLTLSPRTLLVPSTVALASVPPMLTRTGADADATSGESDLPLTPPRAAAAAATLSVPAGAASASASATSSISPQLAPPSSPSTRIDGLHHPCLPRPYVSINPDLLRDGAWSFRDLQLLCMRLQLGGKGRREELVARLLRWHRECFRERAAMTERQRLQAEADATNPLSISKRMKHAANFALLAMDTKSMLHAAGPAAAAEFAAAAAPIPAPVCSPPARSGSAAAAAAIVSPENEGHANGPLPSVSVSSSLPQLLTPLLYRTARRAQDGRTPRGILSPHPGAYDPTAPDSASKKRLSFSVFNGVKLIPSRHQIRALEAERTPSPTAKKLDMNTSSSSESDFGGEEEQRVEREREAAEEQRRRWEQEQQRFDEQMREADLQVEVSPAAAASGASAAATPAAVYAAAVAATAAAASAAASPAPSAPRRNSFFSAVSDAILRVLSPRRPAHALSAAVAPAPASSPLPSPTLPASSYSSHFTFDRLPSIAAHHGDESACSEEYSGDVSVDSVDADASASEQGSAFEDSMSMDDAKY